MQIKTKTPLVNNEVKPILNEQVLTLSLESNEFICNKNQALVWALCVGGFSTVEQIIFQLNTLEEFKSEASIEDSAVQIIEAFEEIKFLTLFENEQPEYPTDLAQFSHIFSSRGGVYGLNNNGFKRLANGMFFGLSFDDTNNLLAFDFPHLISSQWRVLFGDAKRVLDSNEGTLVRLKVNDGIMISQEIGFTGLANNCHYVVRENDYYYAVDTERQSILRVSDKNDIDLINVFDADDNYYHINALVKFKEKWLLMKSVSSMSNLDSSFAIFDDQWSLIEEIDLPAERAHDFLILDSSNSDEPEFWYCDSNSNQIKHYPSGDSIPVTPHIKANNTTRGLSETDQHWVVGNGRYGRYYAHHAEPELLGAISFINKLTHNVDHHVLVPEAPCCIVKNPWSKNI